LDLAKLLHIQDSVHKRILVLQIKDFRLLDQILVVDNQLAKVFLLKVGAVFVLDGEGAHLIE
jgi:hypothetical protein